METILQVNHLSKAFGSNVVLRDIDFSVKKGEVISIIGASVSILYLIGLVVLVAWLGNAFGTIV